MKDNPSIVFIQKYHQYFDPSFIHSDEYKSNPKKYDLMMKVSSFYHCSGGTKIENGKSYNSIIDYINRDEANGDKSSITNELIKERLIKSGWTNNDISNYMGDRPGSTGLFNADGDVSFEKRKELKKQMSELKTNIYECVLSFTPEFSSVNVNDKKQAYELLKKVMPEYFKACGLSPNNIEWFSAYHTNTDNRHMHIIFFEKEPSTYTMKGEISNPKFTKKMLANMKSLIALNTKPINHEYEKLRDPILKNVEDYIKENFNNDQISEIRNLIHSSGHKQFARMNNETKKKIENFKSDLFDKCPSFKEAYNKHEDALLNVQKELNNLFKENNISKENIPPEAKYFASNRKDDIDNRIYNRIIKSCLDTTLYPTKAKTFYGQLQQRKIFSSTKRNNINNQLKDDTSKSINKMYKLIDKFNLIKPDNHLYSQSYASGVWAEQNRKEAQEEYIKQQQERERNLER